MFLHPPIKKKNDQKQMETMNKHGGGGVLPMELVQLLHPTLGRRGLQPARLIHLWDFPGKNTGLGCHFLLQGIFPMELESTKSLGRLLAQYGNLLSSTSQLGNEIKENEQLDPSANRYLRVTVVGEIRRNMSKDPAE